MPVRVTSDDFAGGSLLELQDPSMPRWFFAFAAVAAVLALGLMFAFVRSGATQNTRSMPEAAAPARP